MSQRMTEKEIKGWQNWAKTRMDYSFEEWQEQNK